MKEFEARAKCVEKTMNGYTVEVRQRFDKGKDKSNTTERQLLGNVTNNEDISDYIGYMLSSRLTLKIVQIQIIFKV